MRNKDEIRTTLGVEEEQRWGYHFAVKANIISYHFVKPQICLLPSYQPKEKKKKKLMIQLVLFFYV
jgi:hypothetical protein